MKRRNRRLKIVSLLLLLWLVSACKTVEPEIIVKTEKVYPQEITFPTWPVFYEDEISYGDGTVILPEWLWIAFGLYYEDIKKTEELYKLFRSE